MQFTKYTSACICLLFAGYIFAQNELTINENGLIITVSEKEFKIKKPLASYTKGDEKGTTSIRFDTKKEKDANKYPTNSKTVFGNRNLWADSLFKRDRDLGQTFYSGKKAKEVTALILKVGPNDPKIPSKDIKIAIEFFEVSGLPVLRNNDTPGFLGKFDRANAPELDDFIDGEIYSPIGVVTGTLPQNIKANDYIKFQLSKDANIKLEADKQYAFMLMFLERADECSLSLANQYYGSYAPDDKNKLRFHAIRREGFPDFPDEWLDRLYQSPGTFGFPDVCTYRDLYFIVQGR